MKNLVKLSGMAAAVALLPAPLLAQDEAPVEVEAESSMEGESGVKISGYVGLVTDYRWRGASLSDEDPAVQGGFHASAGGFYAGVWGSNIGFLGDTVDPVTGATVNGSELEIDYYAGYGIPLSGSTTLDLQAKYVTFPGQEDAAFFRVSANLTGTAGKVNWGLHADYEPSQSDTLLAGNDNSYLYATASAPLGDSGFSVNGKVGRENGAFANEKIDWLLGVNKSVGGLDLAVQYIGTDQSGPGVDDTVVVSVSRSF